MMAYLDIIAGFDSVIPDNVCLDASPNSLSRAKRLD